MGDKVRIYFCDESRLPLLDMRSPVVPSVGDEVLLDFGEEAKSCVVVRRQMEFDHIGITSARVTVRLLTGQASD